jgi:hypothetical protein
MFRSKILWAILLAVISSLLIVEAKTNLPFNPVRTRILDAVATPGAYFAALLYPPGIPTGGGSRIWVALALTFNFLVYAFFWYACIWITSYLRARQHPYDRGHTLVPPSSLR